MRLGGGNRAVSERRPRLEPMETVPVELRATINLSHALQGQLVEQIVIKLTGRHLENFHLHWVICDVVTEHAE